MILQKISLFLPRFGLFHGTVIPLVLRRVEGTSMLPALPEGKLVVAIRWYRRLRVGDIVIFEHAGLEKIKRITKMKSGNVYVTGTNPAHSTDSRHFGWLNTEDIKAKVLTVKV